jgi:uncharacterized membrane protein SirB2
MSGAFFALRGVWMLRSPHLLQLRWVKTVPHVVDTALLGSAVYLSYVSTRVPFVFPWLTAKVLALMVYILLGSVALKRGKTLGIRTTAYVAALLVFGYIVAVALTKNPLPW